MIDSFLSVILISGLAGAGKTTLATVLTGINRVPDLELGGDGWPESSEAVALHLADRLGELADRGQRGRVVVELNHRADTPHVALMLEALLRDRGPACRRVVINQLFTVARVEDIGRHLFRDTPSDADDFETAERLATQLEFATTVALVGVEAAAMQRRSDIKALIARLNPKAAVGFLSAAGKLSQVLSFAGLRGSDVARDVGRSQGWMRELAGRGTTPERGSAITSVVFRDPRPFHPERLAAVLEACLEPEDVGLIIRSRGLMQLATRADRVGSWSSAGTVVTIEPTGMESWDAQSPVGQEIVFTGRALRPELIARALRAALLGDDELVSGPMEWATYSDPFPEWVTEHEH
ncbi:cobalamin biosynthesis protein CobW [Glaciihabitans sp. INWT7]|uniref:GTP-binding protein n=1 Tax=Glaciihabitans sp. INWT7 TaxID=2596912 RepID=UPI001624B444|nr:GTP-binding protein [Glaciihabitans sp. INWT7]QNE46160.1 cobalamin biosynthesis protein CobW [Glaciihabitans sp. INWT7]